MTQDGLKRDAASIRAELVRVRDQMRQLGSDDAPAVDRAIQQMDTLSRDEMERVIQTLRGASRPDSAATLSAQARALTAALKDQGSISASLKRLAITLDARQSMENMSAELSALLARQVAAKDELSRLSRHGDLTPDHLHDRDHERYEVVNEDQKTLSEDIRLLLTRLERVAATLTGDMQQKYARVTAVAHDAALADLATRAAALTAQGPFDQAADAQGRTAAVLVGMEQALGSGTPPADRLASLREQLRQLLDQQQGITQLIAGFHERQSVEDDTKRQQTTISDGIVALSAALQPINVQAASALDAAHAATEQASLHYIRMWEERAEAQQSTRDAVTQLTAALAALDKQTTALAANTPTTPAQLDAALAALARDTAQAAAALRNAAAPPTPDQQRALQDQVDNLQQRALPVSPEAAQQLAAAAQDLRQSGPAAQQAAAQQLAQSARTLAQQQAALEGRTPAQQALAQAEKQLAQATQSLTQTQPELGSDKTSAQAVNDLNAVRQAEAAAQQAAAQANAPADAQAALAEANRDLAQAQADAAATQLPQAQADAQAAQQAMARAQGAMDAARQAPMQQAMAAMGVKAGNDPGKLQNGNTAQGEGNGGGGLSGDFLAGAGASASAPAEPLGGLDPKDRAAVTQLRSEKPPAEYAPDVQQYYKNLADGAGLSP